MGRYALKRLGYGVLVLLLVIVFVFFTLRAIPGDVVRIQLGDAPGVTQEDIDRMARELGLDQPVLTQFWSFLTGALQGDLGQSFTTREDVTSMILERLPRTLQLGTMAIVLGLLIGIPLGLLSAIKRNTLTDQFLRLVSVAGISIPNFWLALILITYLALWFGWSPPLVYQGPTQDFGANFQHMILPAIALSASTMASVARMLRSSMLENLGSNYIRTVRAKGASESSVLLKHAGRNSVIPVFTLLGLQAGHVLGGTVILESIFAIPGMGSLIFESVQDRDYPVVLGCVIVYGAVFILINLAVDLVYGLIDPRIRYQ
ncbi:ABC transporter permease subunit [Epidermidibacterium keratini]|uniref:ABC transporter permease subunit n=1 Tax=Epidermidibacterium keratini TaxID=1891644 RepID=A0A7L4YQR2_9ACTN|nr:ABC transporter permease [Epidermidibacterium keratini]QHC01283.1 ABC transporter permease subunit [Epidermidibacterium keratini]